ncbi:Glycosyltransferase involved in cell wall bisynthesis [Nitrosomonas eutropha]|uniref:glycosyltransferase family 2 protein n=1 Tax=Nitrosomonas TaxID=914 RepID=UPI0008950A1C|nr:MULTISPECIES: glycosyltransferase family 2 protein [Nitrosomonas]MXS79219.1 glycosyltransferase family 2 protein [Nitrosomonas sp. GH22]SDW65544.1 Glycosyltransferase involved in cell wall bisynthesis [Nitrosomonas eutropha]
MSNVPKRIHPLISIVTPFYNSIGKANRLLSTFATMSDPDVELIWVDDGSTDETWSYLQKYKDKMCCRCIVVQQENKGPGGARNHGLSLASGRYIWFVDSDDDINPSAIGTVRRLGTCDYDFIDFEVKHFSDDEGRIKPSAGLRAGALELLEGEYYTKKVTRYSLLHTVGWLWTKVFRREFLVNHGVFYPEYCVYEDTPLFFWLPFIVKRFYKSNDVAYFHHQEQESVTRSVGHKGPRFYDRLPTASYGLMLTSRFTCSRSERLLSEEKFKLIFLLHTLKILYISGDWLMIPRVMRFYREEARRLGVSISPLRMISKSRLVLFIAPWLLSYLYPSQRNYFDKLHLHAWGVPIQYPTSENVL